MLQFTCALWLVQGLSVGIWLQIAVNRGSTEASWVAVLIQLAERGDFLDTHTVEPSQARLVGWSRSYNERERLAAGNDIACLFTPTRSHMVQRA